MRFITLSSWYFASLESLYFDLYADSKLQRFKIVVKTDLSDTSLQVINRSIIVSNALKKTLESYNGCDTYMICEDALVYFCNHDKTWVAYAGLTSAPFTNIVTQWNGHIHSLCSTSGRFVYLDHDDGSKRIVVVDLF